VSRGQYGTAAASHAAAAPVYSSYWLDSLNEPNPGLSHSFRVAAFGPGGVSRWRYFEVKLVKVVPATLPAKGGGVEVVLTGGGALSGNVSVHLNPETRNTKPEIRNPKPN